MDKEGNLYTGDSEGNIIKIVEGKPSEIIGKTQTGLIVGLKINPAGDKLYYATNDGGLEVLDLKDKGRSIPETLIDIDKNNVKMYNAFAFSVKNPNILYISQSSQHFRFKECLREMTLNSDTGRIL